MTSKKAHLLLITSLILVAVGAIASIKGAESILSRQSADLAQLRAVSEAMDGRESQHAKDLRDLKEYAELNTIAQTVVPQDKDQAVAVREIADIAKRSGITKLSSITFAPSTLGNTTTKNANPNLTQVTPVTGMPGVFELPITITQAEADKVPYRSFMAFLQGLEQNRRTAQVSSINVQPDPKNPNNVSFTLVINEYIKP